MDSMLFMDIDLAFFKSFFGSKEDEEENKDKIEENKDNKNENNKKKEIKKETKRENQNQRSKSESNKDKGKKNENKQSEKEENNINKIIIEKDEDKKEKDKIIDDNKNLKTNEADKNNKKNKSNKTKKDKKRTKEQLLNYLVMFIKKVYLFKKSVKKLIQRQKENYAITSSVNSNDLCMEIYLSEDKTQKVKYTYEPILKENIFYIPKKLLRKKNLLKFSFLNKKKENIIDQKFNTEYDCGEFINVLNLKKIKDKEEEREEDFQSFLESYYTLKQAMSKETTSNINKYHLEVVRIKKKHRTLDNKKNGLVFGVGKIPSNSILKQRGEHRKVTSNKKISFSDKNETIAYKKDE